MKLLILATIFAIAAASSYKPGARYEQVTHGPHQPYSFGYDVKDKETDFDHAEQADGKVTTGSYRVELPDGRTQFVTYKADGNGNVADVKYEGEAQYPEYQAPADARASPYTPAYTSPVYNAPAYAGLSFPQYKTPSTYPAYPKL